MVTCEVCNSYQCQTLRKLLTNYGELDKRVVSCETGVAENTETIKKQEERIKMLESAEKSKAVSTTDDTVQIAVSELEERNRKKNNLRITNCPEPEQTDPKKKNLEDLDRVIDIAKEAGVTIDKKNITKCYRRGSIKKDKPRPMFVKLKDHDTKMEILRNSYRLKKSKVYMNTRVAPDLTKCQQKNLSVQYEKAKAKNEEEKDANFKWIVAGAQDYPKLLKINLGEQKSPSRKRRRTTSPSPASVASTTPSPSASPSL